MIQDRFRLRYRLTPEHYVLFSRMAVKRLRKKRSWKSFLLPLPFAIVIGLLVVVAKRSSYLTPHETDFLLSGVIIGIFLVYLFYLVLLKAMKARTMVGGHTAMVGEFKLAAYDGGGLQISGQHIQSSYDWSAIIDISQGPELLVLWLDRAAGIIVPDRAFANDEEKQQFIDYINERIEAHKQVN